jgi:hypothetical protein
VQHSTKSPTKAERARFENMLRLGCVACAFLELWSPADEVHHLILGGRRMGHDYTIPLCRGHHRGQWRWEQMIAILAPKRISIASGRRRWNSAYPTERQLWERVQDRLHLSKDWPESKILPRRLG